MTRKKNPVRYDFHLSHADLQRVNEEKDLCVMITSKLTWETQVLMVIAKANKLLGRRTCPMLTDVKVKRSLYLHGTNEIPNELCNWSVISQPLNFKAESWKNSKKSYTLDSTNQGRLTVLQRETDPSGSVTAYLWPRGQGFSISL